MKKILLVCDSSAIVEQFGVFVAILDSGIVWLDDEMFAANLSGSFSEIQTRTTTLVVWQVVDWSLYM